MTERITNKIPYVASHNKRYEISKDEFSRRRIEALRDICHELQAQLPLPISISVFGSLVKGKELTHETALETDIDCKLRFDIEEFRALPEETILKLGKKFGIEDLNVYLFEKLLKEIFIEKLNKVKDKLNLKETLTEHVFVGPIDSDSIQDAVNYRMMSHTWEDKGASVSADVRLNSYFTLSIGNAVKKYIFKEIGF